MLIVHDDDEKFRDDHVSILVWGGGRPLDPGHWALGTGQGTTVLVMRW